RATGDGRVDQGGRRCLLRTRGLGPRLPDGTSARLRVVHDRGRRRVRRRDHRAGVAMNIPWLTVALVMPIGASLLLQLIPRSATALLKGFTVAATLATAILVWAL